jgi:outer membrane receptor for ferrienterochelin and colicins
MRWRIFAVFTWMVGISLVCAGQVPSTDLADTSLEQLGNVKVYSASRHLQSVGDAPSSVTVITSEDIHRYGYRTLADILQTVRGFFVTYDRNYSSVGVRGFARPGDFNTRVLLLVDGHRLNDNVYDEAMLGTEFPIDIDLIERVEVIRGPVSSLYGSNALFAVINIITRRGADLKGLEISANAGSWNTYAGRVSYGQRLHELEFLVSGSFYGSRGHNQLFFPEFNTPETNNGLASHIDNDQLGSALATISYRDFTLQGIYGTREKAVPTGAYGTWFNYPGTSTTDAHDYLDLRYEHTFAQSWNVLARGFYDRYTYYATYIYPSTLDSTQPMPDLDYSDGKWWGTELQITKTILARHRVTGGGEYRDNLRQNQGNYTLNPYSLLLDDRRQSFVGALYLQDEVSIARSITLNAGFRYDYYDKSDASIDPRVALICRPGRLSTFKVIYARAFRVPNVYELYYSVAPNLPNPKLDPEKIRSTEVVWEQGLGKRLWFSTSGFHNVMKDLITSEPLSPDSVIFENEQNVDSSGLELELRGQLPRETEVTASYSFQETTDHLTHELLSNSPRNLGKLNLSHPLFDRKLFLSLDGQYRARMQSLDSSPVSPFSVFNFTVLGRNLGHHLDIAASIYNVLDKRYADPPSAANLQLPIPQDGRSFRVKLTWNWGAH